MEGVIAEGAEMIEEEADDEVKDAGLIAAAQRVEHLKWPGMAQLELMVSF
jgi:ferritin-like metal-binding protein YciE